jgi:hypothetical protein
MDDADMLREFFGIMRSDLLPDLAAKVGYNGYHRGKGWRILKTSGVLDYLEVVRTQCGVDIWKVVTMVKTLNTEYRRLGARRGVFGSAPMV